MHLVLALVVLGLLVVFLRLVPKIDQTPRVDDTEWRIRPSRSGKTWEAYRWIGSTGMVEGRNRFRSPEAASEWVRQYGVHIPKKDANGWVGSGSAIRTKSD